MVVSALVGILITLVAVISLMQKYYPDHRNFPEILKDWKFLPIYFRSLEPYDKFIMNYLCCVDCCSKVVQNKNYQEEVIITNHDLNSQPVSRRVIRFSESLDTDEQMRNVEKDCDDVIVIEKIEEKEEPASKKHIKFSLDNIKNDNDLTEIKEEEEEEKEINIKNDDETISAENSSNFDETNEKKSIIVGKTEENIVEDAQKSKRMHTIKLKKVYFTNASFESEQF
jgi:hypothetical protein